MIFVRNAEDCGSVGSPVEFVAAHFIDKGVEVQGVVLRRGSVDAAVELASRAFPHTAISPHSSMPFVLLGHSRTPIALVVDPVGRIVKVETVAGQSIGRVVQALEESLAR